MPQPQKRHEESDPASSSTIRLDVPIATTLARATTRHLLFTPKMGALCIRTGKEQVSSGQHQLCLSSGVEPSAVGLLVLR